jgi:opacity protein-like surface antigen
MWASTTLALWAIHCVPAAADSPDLPPLFAVSELKIGGLEHDTTGLWSGFTLERAAVDANFEVLFTPWARAFGGYLRPAVGATVNFNGDTSKAYADVRWEIEAPYGVFFALGLGAAIHDGHLSADAPDHKALGSRVLFHPSAELGYRFDGANSISIFADHISNGFTRRNNEGMDTVGIRLGHRFGPLVAPETVDVAIADFSGPYIGASAGYQFENADWLAASAARSTTSDYFTAAFAGYSWQSGRGVFGVEVDASPFKSSLSAVCIGPAIACQMDVHGLYSVRSRFGWVIDHAMVYGTAGLAIAPWDSSAVNLVTGQQLATVNGTNYGVAVGAGIEYKLTPHVGVRAEIMHYGLPGRDLFVPGTGPTTNQFGSTVGRAGITWYFY